jgi:hypothetical protein
MNSLRLLPGPKLLWHSFEMKAADEAQDYAHKFLQEPVTIEDGVTLADVFNLFTCNPKLQECFQRNFIQEICAEVVKGNVQRDEDPARRIEYVELAATWTFDSHTKDFMASGPRLHGVGPEQEADWPDMYVKKGERIKWALSLTAIREVLDKPLRVRTRVSVQESDVYARAYGKELYSVQCTSFTLGDVLAGVLGTLAFHGGPTEQREVAEELTQQVADLDAGKIETFSMDRMFGSEDRASCATMFESIGDLSPSDVSDALRHIGDTDNAAASLRTTLGDSVVVKAAYCKLGGRDFRVAFRDAGRVESRWGRRLEARRRELAGKHRHPSDVGSAG